MLLQSCSWEMIVVNTFCCATVKFSVTLISCNCKEKCIIYSCVAVLFIADLQLTCSCDFKTHSSQNQHVAS